MSNTLGYLYNMAEDYNRANVRRCWDCLTIGDEQELAKKSFCQTADFLTESSVNKKYDAVFLDDLWENEKDPVKYLCEWKNVLNFGGWIFLAMHNMAYYFLVEKLLLGEGVRKEFGRYTLSDLEEIVNMAGYCYTRYVSIKENVRSNDFIKRLQNAKVLGETHVLLDKWYCMMISPDDPAETKYKLPYPLEVRRELGYLLRRIENDIDVSETISALLNLCADNVITADDLYYAVDNMTMDTVKVMRYLISFTEKDV